MQCLSYPDPSSQTKVLEMRDQETRDILGHCGKYPQNRQEEKLLRVHVCEGQCWVIFAWILLNLNFS